MTEKQNNDKSFERKNQQKNGNSPVENDSAPAASYREIRAKSESERKKKAQVNKSKAQRNQGDKRRSPQSKKTVQQRKPQQNPPKKNEQTSADGMNHQHSRTQVKPKQSGNNNPRPKNNPHSQNKANLPEEKTAVSEEVKKKAQDIPDEKLDEKQSAAEKKQDAKPKKKRKMKRSSKPFSAKKRRRKILAMYSSMVVIILMIAAVLCLTVFFKIDSINVEGETRYSTEEIIEASGITVGTNLLLCNTEPGKEVITKNFPYIESVSIKKNPFNSVTIYVEEAKPTTAIETNGNFYILSAKGKIIEILDNNKYNVPLIKGAELKKTELSATIEYKLASMGNIINEVTKALENNDITKVSTINVTNPSNIKLSYDKRLTIILGIPENIDYKVETAKVIIDQKLEKDSKGTIDVSMCAEGGKYSYYDPSGAPEN